MKTNLRGLVLVLLFQVSAFAGTDADFHLRIKNKIFTKVIDQVMKHFNQSNGYIRKDIPSQNIDLTIDISEKMDVEDAHYYANNILGINLKGQNKVKFFIENPMIQAKVKIDAPKFFAQNATGSNLNLNLGLTLENYFISFKHIWFAEEGFTQASSGVKNADSCQNLIREGRYQGNDIDVAKYKAEYDSFFEKVKASNFYSKINDSLWVRVDNLQLGWSSSHHSKVYSDNRNKLKVDIVANMNLAPAATTFKITKMSQNFGKKGGSYLPVYLPEKNIIIPPIMIRTTRPVVDEQGFYVKDEQGKQVLATRCTPVDVTIAKKMATEVVQDFSRKIPSYITDDMIESVVASVNKQVTAMKIDLPTKLEIVKESVFNGYEEKKMEVFGTSYVYKVPKKIEGDLKEQVKKIIGDFYDYRAALGLYGINTSEDGSKISMAINGGLVIDNSQIAYRERDERVSYAKNFAFPDYNNEDVAFSVSRDFLQKIINIVRDRYLQTNIPEIVNISVDDNSIFIDNAGYLNIKPELMVKVSGYDVVSIPGLTIKAKLGFYTDAASKRRMFNIELIVPNGKEIVGNVKLGKAVKFIDKMVDVIFLNPFTWPIIPLKNQVLKPAVKDKLASVVQKYIDQVKNNYTSFDIQDIVAQYGVTPRYFIFHSAGHAAIYAELEKVVKIDDKVKALGEKLDKEIKNLKLDLNLKF